MILMLPNVLKIGRKQKQKILQKIALQVEDSLSAVLGE
jgi:hypothetical protein